MNKTLLFLILVFFSFGSDAQNWQCFKANDLQYFVNNDHYLRAVKIDSVNINGADTIYRLYPTLRHNYYNASTFDTTGGSWAGGVVTARTNGDYLFKVRKGDTLTVKTLAHTGNTWTMYTDTLNIIFEATVVSEDTMTVLGSVDSIKKISLTAKMGSSILSSNPVNGKQIILSKNHGIIQTIELYTFPYRDCGSLNYGTITDGFFANANKNGISDFHLIKMPTNQDVYNYDIGDVLEFRWDDGGGPHYVYNTDTVIAKTTIGNTIQYTFYGEVRDNAGSKGYIISYGTSTFSADINLIYHDIPEKYDNQLYPVYLETRFYEDTNSYCVNSPQFIFYINAVAYFHSYSLKVGVGKVMQSDFRGQAVTSRYLLYSKIKGIECGKYQFPVTVNHLNQSNLSSLYPNPANEQLIIELNNKAHATYSLALIDLFGKTVLQLNTNQEKETVNTSQLPEGVYVIQIKSNTISNTQKLIIRH